MRLLWLLVVLPLAGCVEDPTYAVSGSFTEDRTDSDIEELQALADQHDGSVQIRETAPEQFTIGDLSEEDCETVRAILVEKEYLEDVGACVEQHDRADPN